MLQSLGWAALGTGFTFLMTALGAAMVFFFAGEPRPRFQRTLLGFAAGVMTAASVWSLLIPAIDQAAAGGQPPWLPAAGGMLLGVVFLAALDALLPHLRRDRQDARQATLLMTAITLHNVPEGMAVGLAFALAAGGEGRLAPQMAHQRLHIRHAVDLSLIHISGKRLHLSQQTPIAEPPAAP